MQTGSRLAFLVLGWAYAVAVPAQAQPPAEEPARELPEVVVTAQKVEQTLRDVPASVSVLGGQFIRETGAFDLTDLQGYYGNVDLTLTPTDAEFRIRGFGTSDINKGFEPSVSSVVDGIVYGRSNFMSAFFYDLDRVEVLRGPQGTLFGKNSTAGVINVVTNPPTHEFGGNLEGLIGDDGQRSERGALNLPLTDGLALRFAGNLSQDRGALFNTDLDRRELNFNQKSGRVRLRLDPDPDWTADLTGFFSHHHFNDGQFQLTRVSPDMLALIQKFDPRADANGRDFKTSLSFPGRSLVNYTGAHLNVAYALPQPWHMHRFDLTSITAWARMNQKDASFDADFSPVPFIHVGTFKPTTYRQISQELRASGSAPSLFGRGYGFNFVSGLFFNQSNFNPNRLIVIEDLGAAFDYETAAQATGHGGSPGGILGGVGPDAGQVISQLLPLLDPALNPLGLGKDQNAQTRLRQNQRASAAFTQFEYQFVPKWSFIGGFRYGTERKIGDFLSQSQGRLVSLLANEEDFQKTLRRRETEFSPKAGFKWAPARHTNFFFTWSRGFKSGGFNADALNQDNLEFGPERASSFELGVKSRLPNGAMQVSATGFVTQFRNLQVTTFQNTQVLVLNAARARSAGMELDLQWLPPLNGLSVLGSAGFDRAIFTSYPNAPAIADSGQNSQDLSGRVLPFAPRWSGSLTPGYAWHVPAVHALAGVAVDLLYKSDRFLSLNLDPRTRQSATKEVNARLLLGDPNRAWNLTLSGKNLTKQVIFKQILDQPLAPGNFAGIRSDRGRVALANFAWNFYPSSPR